MPLSLKTVRPTENKQISSLSLFIPMEISLDWFPVKFIREMFITQEAFQT